MKKRTLLLGLVTAVYLFTPFETSGQSSPPVQQGFANYITISNGEFHNGDSIFKPLCINYLVDYACYIHPATYHRTYYIAPCFNYSATGTGNKETEINDNIYDWHWCYGTDGQTEMVNARAKLDRDLRKIDSLGFNVVRLRPAIYWRNDSLQIPTRSYAKYFELTDTLIDKCARNNLRVIMVLSDKPNTHNQFEQYCVYLDSVTRHYSTNKTVMAYVVYMEPLWKWENAHVNDKIMISNWARKWYYLIKKNAPNQLVTYGLDGLSNILIWDPSALTYDFLSMHFYHLSNSSAVSSRKVANYFKWMSSNVNDVWVLGETGFSGTVEDDTCTSNPHVGTTSEQRQYALATMQKSLDCGCKGYAWWQYQEVMWDSCYSKHFGIVKFSPNDSLKEVSSVFPTYESRTAGAPCLVIYADYYNMYGQCNLTGVVVNENNSNPIQDAVINAWTAGYRTQYTTFTDSQGVFRIYTPADTVLRHLWISYKGFSCKKLDFSTPPTDPIVLTHLNYNHWKKNWTNINYPKAGDTVLINSTDRVIVGNFYGDEAQEMLVLKALIPSSSQAELYRFHTDHWEKIWAGPLGNWNIGFNDKFFAGDYNGDGYDELLCVQNNPNGWASIFHYGTLNWKNPWVCIWTNQGNGQIGEWNYATGDILLPGRFNDSTYCSLICIRNQGRMKNALCQRLQSSSWTAVWLAASLNENTYIGSWPISEIDKYYVGDFSGDGIDELFCVQSTNGTSDMMTLMQYNAFWTTLWSNNGISEGLGIYPYRANLHVGNYDTDQADEFLGVGSWATKFDFNTSNQWDWSWSTYESGKLSDWSVNPTHRIFFLKTMTDVPDYLFVIRGNPSNDFKFDGYSYDP